MGNDVTVTIKGKDELSPTLESASTKAKGLGTTMGTVGKAITAGLAVEAGKGLVEFLGHVVEHGEAAEKSNESVKHSIDELGAGSWTSADAIDQLSLSLSNNTGVSAETIKSSAATLLAFTQVKNAAGDGNDVFNRTLSLAQDLSAKGFGPLETTTKKLGKAMDDPIKGMNTLARSGVVLTQSQKDEITALEKSGDLLGAQKALLDDVDKAVGGTAAATATASDKMRASWDNFQTQLGEKVVPILSTVLDKLTGVVQWAGAHPEIVEWALAAGAALAGLGLVVKGVNIVKDVAGWAQSIGSALKGIVTSNTETATATKATATASKASSIEQVAANDRAAASANASATSIERSEARAAAGYRTAGLAATGAATEEGLAGDAAMAASDKAAIAGTKFGTAVGKFAVSATGLLAGGLLFGTVMDKINTDSAGGAEHLQGLESSMHNFLGGLKELATDPGKALGEIVDQLKGVHDQFVAGTSDAAKFWHAITDANTSGVTTLSQGMWTGGATAGKSLSDGLWSAAPGVAGASQGLWTSAKTGVAQMPASGHAAGDGFGKGAASGISQNSGTVSGASQGLWGAATRGTSGMPASGTSAGYGFGQGVSTGVQSKTGAVGQAAGSLWNAAKSGTAGMPGSGNAPGSGFGQSLASGINSAVGSVAAAAARLAASARSGGSPGSLFGEGASFGQSLAQGINSAVGNVIAAGQRLAAAAAAASSHAHFPSLGFAHGGIVGAAVEGGSRGGLTLVGESGPELVSLPSGSMVHSNPDTQRMMSGGGGGGPIQVVLSAKPGADQAVATMIMGLIRTGKIQLNVS